MTIADKLGRLFQTESFIRRESARWAGANFAGPNEVIARTVVHSLVAVLNVDFERLTRDTDIVRDLAADEWTEWAQIQMGVEDQLQCVFHPDARFSGRTIADLVHFVARHKSTPLKERSQRRLSKSTYSFAACLDARQNSLPPAEAGPH